MQSAIVFVHIRRKYGWDNFAREFDYIPHAGDCFSLSTEGAVYEVEHTLFNFFECTYRVEVYAHEYALDC